MDLAIKPMPKEDGTIDDPIDEVSYEDDALPSEIVEHRELKAMLRQAVTQMTDPDERQIIELYDYAQNAPTLQDVANTLGIKLSLAKKLHVSAKNSLKRALRSLISELNSNDTPDHES